MSSMSSSLPLSPRKNIITSSNVFHSKKSRTAMADKKIRSYYFSSKHEGAVEKARIVIENEMKIKGRSITFSLDNLESQLKENPFLVRNGNILSLSNLNVHETQECAPLYLDSHFSMSCLNTPVRCEKNHYFEKSRFTVWLSNHNTMCPSGTHALASSSIEDYPDDIDFQNRIQIYFDSNNFVFKFKQENISTQKALASTQQAMISTQQELALANTRIQSLEQSDQAKTIQIEQQKNQIEQLNNNLSLFLSTTFDPKMALLGSGKVALKVIMSATALELIIQLSKDNPIASTFATAIPVIGCVLGVVLFFARVRLAQKNNDKTQYAKACIELASGLLSLIPNLSSSVSLAASLGASLSLDLGVLLHDYLCREKTLMPKNIDEAYAILDLEKDRNPTKEEVDRVYGGKIAFINTPEAKKIFEAGKIAFDKVRGGIEASKKMIYKDKDWTDPENLRFWSSLFSSSSQSSQQSGYSTFDDNAELI